MTKEEKKKYFLKALANNDMVQLYGIDGMPLDLDYQGHICFSISDIPLIGNSLERRIFGIHAAIYLATIWKIHLEKSFYPKKYVLAVQVEAEWILGKRLAPPPYVILNTINREKIYSYNFFKECDKDEKEKIIEMYNLEDSLMKHDYKIYTSSKNDLRILLVYKE